MSERERDEITFSVFLLHALADAWERTVPEVYRILDETDIMGSYIIPCYDPLHCLGKDYLVSDITDLARKKGYAL